MHVRHRKFLSIVRSMYLLVGSVQMFGLVAMHKIIDYILCRLYLARLGLSDLRDIRTVVELNRAASWQCT